MRKKGKPYGSGEAGKRGQTTVPIEANIVAQINRTAEAGTDHGFTLRPFTESGTDHGSH
jgi:hypothetical protein